MNVIFGHASARDGDVGFQRLRDTVESIWGGEATAMGSPGGQCRCGVLGGEKPAIGAASEGDVDVLVIGPLYGVASDSDTFPPVGESDRAASILLDRYRRLGDHLFDGVYGHYRAIVCDRGAGRVVLAGDPDQFFYAETDDGLLFASHPLAAAKAMDPPARLDRSTEDFLLVHGFAPLHGNLFAGVRELTAGKTVTWQDGRIETREFACADPWRDHYDHVDFAGMDEAEAVDLAYDAFMRAVEDIAPATDSAVLLGGLDSSLVASALCRLGKRVETFTFDYDDARLNQPHVDLLTDFLGTRHNSVRMTPEIMREEMEHYGLRFNAPSNYANYITQTRYVCALAKRRGFAHCYAGDGGDTIFVGTHEFKAGLEHVARSPLFCAPTRRLMLAAARAPGLEWLLGRFYRVGHNVLRSLERPPELRDLITFWVFSEPSLARLRLDAPPEQQKTFDEWIRLTIESLGEMSRERLILAGKSCPRPGRLKISGSVQSEGVTFLSPYQHPGLRALAWRLPESVCSPEGDSEGKYVLKRMAEEKGLLPPEVIFQRKIPGNDAPVDRWFAGPLSDDAMRWFEDLPFDANQRYLRRLLRPNVADALHRRFICSDNVTSHEAMLLSTYARIAATLK